jgi:hypothetical protein
MGALQNLAIDGEAEDLSEKVVKKVFAAIVELSNQSKDQRLLFRLIVARQPGLRYRCLWIIQDVMQLTSGMQCPHTR